MDAPETLTSQQVRNALGRDPKGVVLAVIGERIYESEGSVWWRLDDHCYASLKEMIDGS
jgi:hypothetical protein